ncbi:MAG: DUF2007 domain-containing protein [Bacteroidetes bacterium]|jgi:hypothetical protein|nr:DUF2007 domain-containing protein [Bacteroidota bacterium]MDF1864498.1 DUF2007 domain-containing protein [Saprospiraceae bacterium]
MNTNWRKVFSSGEMVQVRLAKDVLKNNEIESVILNKQDSAYMVFGEQELHVPVELAERAISVLKSADFLN